MFTVHTLILKVAAGHPCLLWLLACRWLELLHNLFGDRSMWLINTLSLLQAGLISQGALSCRRPKEIASCLTADTTT